MTSGQQQPEQSREIMNYENYKMSQISATRNMLTTVSGRHLIFLEDGEEMVTLHVRAVTRANCRKFWVIITVAGVNEEVLGHNVHTATSFLLLVITLMNSRKLLEKYLEHHIWLKHFRYGLRFIHTNQNLCA